MHRIPVALWIVCSVALALPAGAQSSPEFPSVDPDVVAPRWLAPAAFTACTVTIQAGSGSGAIGSSGNVVPVIVSNNVVLASLEVGVIDAPDVLTATGCIAGAPGVGCSASDTGSATFTLSGPIPPGAGFDILFDVASGALSGSVVLSVSGSVAVPWEGDTCDVVEVGGAFEVQSRCGNGVIDPEEDCDDGGTGSTCCRPDCTAEPVGTTCDDGLFCTSSDVCDGAGACAGGLNDCSDGVGCTVDECDEENDTCLNTADDAPCDNGLFCDGAETCDPVADCQAGTPVDCDDGVGCTLDECDEAADACVSTADDAPCDNGLFCDGAETCDPVADCQSGPGPCWDTVDCTVDTCDEAADECLFSPDDGLCDNGLFCDGAETCDPVADCQPGTPVVCEADDVECTLEACDEAAGACVSTPDDALCDNGQFCDGAEVCDPVADCQPGTPVDCEDPFDCTIDSCDEGADACQNIPQDTCPGPGLAIEWAAAGTPIWLFDVVPGTAEPVEFTGLRRANSLARDRSGRFYSTGTPTPGADVPNDRLFTIDPVTLQTTVLGVLDFGGAFIDIRALAFSSDNVLYAVRHDPGDSELWTINIDTLTGTLVGSTGAAIAGLAFSPDDVLYGWDVPLLGLVTVDPATAAITDVGPAGSTGTGAIQTIFFDADEGLYGAGDGLFLIDRDTGVYTQTSEGDYFFRGAELFLAASCTTDAECNDGLFCNGLEFCDPELGCQIGTPPCPLDLCDEIENTCPQTCENDADCDDGVFCNGAETCVTVQYCSNGPLPCPPEVCDEVADACPPTQGVPTVSGWGAILMGLLFVAAASHLFGQTRVATPGPGAVSLPVAAPMPRTARALLAGAAAWYALVLGALLAWSAGALPTRDVVGTAICAPVVGYLISLWVERIRR